MERSGSPDVLCIDSGCSDGVGRGERVQESLDHRPVPSPGCRVEWGAPFFVHGRGVSAVLEQQEDHVHVPCLSRLVEW